MGTGLFDFIAQGCQSLAATAAPSITAMGIHIVVALATMMLVWFGVQEALASSQGGAGFNIGRFVGLFMLLTFAYAMVNFYDSSIPGLGFSIKGFIDGGTANLVNVIGSDGTSTMLNQIHAASSKTGPSMLTSIMSPYYSIVYFVVQFLLAVLAAIVSAIIAYGAIASTIIGLLGPLFIPFLVFNKLDWLFWGWLKAYLGFSFYKVVAAAAMNVLSHVLTNYYVQLGQSLSDPSLLIQTLPLLILLVFVNIYILIKIPAMTQALFSGHTSGGGGGMGLAMMALHALV
jgi:type IV secretory pathway VirB6-like protein